MLTFNIISLKNLEKLKKNDINEILNFINIENKSYKSPELSLDEFIKKYKNNKNDIYYIFILENKKIVGGFRYYKTNIKDKLLLNRFIYKNGLYYVIQSVFVLSQYRRKGFCSMLLKYFFKEINPSKTILAVEAKNKNAIKCYQKNGFIKIVERKIINKILDSTDKSIIDKEFLMIKNKKNLK